MNTIWQEREQRHALCLMWNGRRVIVPMFAVFGQLCHVGANA